MQIMLRSSHIQNQRWIQDISEGGASSSKEYQPIIWPIFAKNCIKMKKIAQPKFYYVDLSLQITIWKKIKFVCS